MSFIGRAGKVFSLTAIVALFMSVAPASAYDPDKFPGKGSRADWEKACELSNRGVSLAEKGKRLEALDLYQKSIKIYPYAGVYYNHAKNLRHLNRVNDSIAAYQKAIQYAPDFVYAYCNLADAFNSIKDFTSAEKACKEALRIKPSEAAAMINLAESYLGLGNKQKAKLWLDRANACPESKGEPYKSTLTKDFAILHSLSDGRQGSGG